LVALFLLTYGCAAAPVAPEVARPAINERSAPPPPLRAVGLVRLRGPAGELVGKGKALLALEGDRFRLQVVDPMGRSLAAVARRGKSFVSLDPRSGARTMLDADQFGRLTLGDFSFPAAMIPALLTGAPPSFDRVVSARRSGAKVTVVTAAPPLTIVYAQQVLSITTANGEELAITAWRDQAGRPYVASATLSREGAFGSVRVEWEGVERVKPYPPGFFQFRDFAE